MHHKLFALALINSLLFSTSSFACTDFSLVAQDGSTLVTRTMEFAQDLSSNLRSSNQGRQFNYTTPDGKAALSWNAKYGYVFLDGMNIDAAVDGMNEKGLSVEALYLPGETEYPSLSPENAPKGVPYIHLGDWILSNFQNIDEVRSALNDITVFSTTLPGLNSMVFPLHFAIYDASGKSLVIEFNKGKMQIYDNNLGVLTNSPTYDWQITNLRNYTNLTPFNPSPVEDSGMVFISTGQGSGMKGLPGDTSPPARFVKMAVLKKAAMPVKNSHDALTLAQHIINTVDIPLGMARAKENGNELVEKTQWTVFKDLTHKVLYYYTYDNSTLSSIDLTKIDLSPSAKRLKMPVVAPQYITDMSKQFSTSVGQ